MNIHLLDAFNSNYISTATVATLGLNYKTAGSKAYFPSLKKIAINLDVSACIRDHSIIHSYFAPSISWYH